MWYHEDRVETSDLSTRLENGGRVTFTPCLRSSRFPGEGGCKGV